MNNLVLGVKKDIYISSRKPDEVFTGSQYLYAGNTNKKDMFCILLRFDLNGITDYSVIERAVLKMYKVSATGIPSACRITPFLVVSEWSCKDTTWNVLPQIDRAVSGETLSVGETGWYAWNITALAKSWVSGMNYGLMLVPADNDTGVKKFYSSAYIYRRNVRPLLKLTCSHKKVFILESRKTKNTVRMYETCNGNMFSDWVNTSSYSMYTFFVRNTGRNPAIISVQLSPDGNAVYNEEGVCNIPPGAVEAIVPRKYGFYSRLAFKPYFTERQTCLQVWFQAQV